MAKYNFFVCKCDKNGILTSNTKKNLEEDFEGVRYQKMTGLNDFGESKLVVTEDYAEQDGVRSYVEPISEANDVPRKNTEIKLSLVFFGKNRRVAYDNFIDYISRDYTFYWDTARLKGFTFVFSNKVSISSELFYNEMPYFIVTFTLQNINGRTFNVDENGNKI